MERKIITVDVPVAGKIICNASRGKSYEMAKTGELEVINFGRRKVVSVAYLENKLGYQAGELDAVIKRELAAIA